MRDMIDFREFFKELKQSSMINMVYPINTSSGKIHSKVKIKVRKVMGHKETEGL